jgi:alpha-L-rhamnosidase
MTPGEIVSDAYYYYDVTLLSKIAQILGKSGDAQAYSQLAAQIKDAFNREFFNAKTGNYATGTQTANALALFLDLVTKDNREAVGRSLFNDIAYQHDSHVTTGFIGVKYLFPVLTRLGQSDLAYDMATQTTYPGWGYMIANGATTLWELWQKRIGPSMNSHNHPMFGSVGAWFYQALTGINVDTEQPGYRHIRIEPQVVRDLTWASGTVETVRGTVSSTWSHSPGVITLDVVVPVNSVATIVIPKEEQMTEVTIREGDRVVWDKGQYVPGSEGVTGAVRGTGGIIFEVGSGRYSFKLMGE